MSREDPSHRRSPAPLGPYSQAAKSQGMVFVSGQVRSNPETGKKVEDGIEKEPEQVLKNVEAILRGAGRP
ncbi:MAG: hypothetical protein HXS52_03825 [Theionarchaea archaeon]|nr:hypothetical protein [Theionarchaea archaeon]MBU7037037.1 hypothetical protein [Theionarchaea archaeon]